MTHKTLLLKLPNQSPESRLPPEAYSDETPFHEFKSSFHAPKNSPDTCPGGVVHSGYIICRADASSRKKTSCKKSQKCKISFELGVREGGSPPDTIPGFDIIHWNSYGYSCLGSSLSRSLGWPRMAAGAAAWKGWRHELLVDAAVPCDPQPLGDRPPSKILTACVFSIRLQQQQQHQQQQLQQQPTPKVRRWTARMKSSQLDS